MTDSASLAADLVLTDLWLCSVMAQTDGSTTHATDRRHRDRNTAASRSPAIRGRGAASTRRGEGEARHGRRRSDTAEAG